MPGPSSRHKGWWYDPTNSRLSAVYDGTEVFDFDANDLDVAQNATFDGTVDITGALTATGEITASGGITLGSAGFFGLGSGEAVTIATGVATITKPYVILDAEGAGTTDQLDTITYTGAAQGDLLLLTVNSTDTITVDDANINLAAATRAIAPGGSLFLLFDGTEWTELFFTAGTDNA